MESIQRKTQLAISSLLLLIVSILLLWYVRIDSTDQYKVKEEITIDYDQAVRIYGEGNAIAYEYKMRRDVMYIKSRTKIPLIFHRDTIVKSKWSYIQISKK